MSGYPFEIRSKVKGQGHRVATCKSIFQAIEWPAWVCTLFKLSFTKSQSRRRFGLLVVRRWSHQRSSSAHKTELLPKWATVRSHRPSRSTRSVSDSNVVGGGYARKEITCTSDRSRRFYFNYRNQKGCQQFSEAVLCSFDVIGRFYVETLTDWCANASALETMGSCVLCRCAM